MVGVSYPQRRVCARLAAVAAWSLVAVGCQQILGIRDRHFGQQDAGFQQDAGVQQDAPREAGSMDDAPLADAPPADGPRPDAPPEDAPPGADGGDAAPTCPAEMVYIAVVGVCIDQYEASAGDGGVAASVIGAYPWNYVSRPEAQTACAAAGKRLCSAAEWTAACRGPTNTYYPYGNAYQSYSCNGSDYFSGAPVATGMMVYCHGYLPVNDLSGNISEWTSDCSGPSGSCGIRGGSFGSGESGLQCNALEYADPAVRSAEIGFRCCGDP
jgi:hypothetical protein